MDETIGDNVRHADADCKGAARLLTAKFAKQFARCATGCCKNFVYNWALNGAFSHRG